MAKPCLSATVTGQKSLEEAIVGLSRVVDAVVNDALRAGAEVIRADAASRAPRGATGRLAKNIIMITEDRVVKVGLSHYPTDVFYGAFQERGTRHHKAQPFLFPAFEAKKREALRIIRDKLRQAVIKSTTHRLRGGGL